MGNTFSPLQINLSAFPSYTSSSSVTIFLYELVPPPTRSPSQKHRGRGAYPTSSPPLTGVLKATLFLPSSSSPIQSMLPQFCLVIAAGHKQVILHAAASASCPKLKSKPSTPLVNPSGAPHSPSEHPGLVFGPFLTARQSVLLALALPLTSKYSCVSLPSEVIFGLCVCHLSSLPLGKESLCKTNI